MANVILLLLVLLLIISGVGYSKFTNHPFSSSATHQMSISQPAKKPTPGPTAVSVSPLSITAMRNTSYPGSSIIIVKTLSPGANYSRYVVSYQSEGYTIYGLLTVPTGKVPVGGFPVILFNHGYIPPATYSTTDSYSVMVDPLASAGYIVFKPDYRGNGNSQGKPTQPYVSVSDITDSMNALSSIKMYKDVNSHKIGVFGHSMGGNITLHELVITHDFKAAELLSGVVGNEIGIAQWWDHRFAGHSIVGNDLDTYYLYEQIIKDHGTPASDPTYWNEIDPTQFLNFINVPVQIQVGTADEEVPTEFSVSLKNSLQKKRKSVSFIEYAGADHNLSPDTTTAMEQTVAFFNKFLK
jgi:uncharacterized protein